MRIMDRSHDHAARSLPAKMSLERRRCAGLHNCGHDCDLVESRLFLGDDSLLKSGVSSQASDPTLGILPYKIHRLISCRIGISRLGDDIEDARGQACNNNLLPAYV